MIKRLQFNEGFKQLARGNLNLLLETEIKAWSEQTNKHKLKSALGKLQTAQRLIDINLHLSLQITFGPGAIILQERTSEQKSEGMHRHKNLSHSDGF